MKALGRPNPRDEVKVLKTRQIAFLELGRPKGQVPNRG